MLLAYYGKSGNSYGGYGIAESLCPNHSETVARIRMQKEYEILCKDGKEF